MNQLKKDHEEALANHTGALEERGCQIDGCREIVEGKAR